MNLPADRARFVVTARLSAGFVALAALVSGCAQQEPAPASPGASVAASPAAAAAAATASGSPGATSAGALRIGLITPGRITDQGWSESAYDGEQRIKTALGARVDPPVEAPADADVPGVMRNLAQQGDTLIFAHGEEYDDPAKAIAPGATNTTISVMGGRTTDQPNLYPIQFQADQATYLAGMVAGGMTRSDKIGLVGAKKIPIVQEAFDAFIRGAKAENPKAQIVTTYVGTEDVARAKQQTQALLDTGVDVVMHNANEGGKGVADAVMSRNGAMFIGANADQSELATPKNLGSFVLDVPSAMVAVAKAVQGGTKGGRAYAAGLKDKAVFFKYNDRFQGTIPPTLKAKVAAAEADIISGKRNPSK